MIGGGGTAPERRHEHPAGSIVSGAGVGLAPPTVMATASASFPTGSPVVTLVRRTGVALGVALLVALVRAAHTGPALLVSDRDA